MTGSIRHRVHRRGFLLGAAGLALPAAVHTASAQDHVPAPVSDPSTYAAYVPAASKPGQFFWYTCEFDAAWAVMMTFGIDAPLDEQLTVMGVDYRIEPYFVETADGFVIYGGNIGTSWSGDYTSNLLARSTGTAMRKVFRHYGLEVGRVKSRSGIRKFLDEGRLIWIKTTVDFKDWVPATWITPEGDSFQVVLGNDHAVVVMGYNDDVVVIRDVLGPTDTNWNRAYEYEVDWDTFMRCWSANGKDGLAVGLPEENATS
jgi:hypothetical protein